MPAESRRTCCPNPKTPRRMGRVSRRGGLGPTRSDSLFSAPKEALMFRLIKSETKPLTPELAEAFKNLPASPTERGFDAARARVLREAAEAGTLITFNWATARVGDKE